MPKKVAYVRPETGEEKQLREWFAAQELESPKTLDEAARLLIGLVTGLLTVLFGVLTIAAEHPPAYLQNSWVRGFGVASIILWLACLGTGLAAVLPGKYANRPGKPGEQPVVFQQILARKSGWLIASAIAFGLAAVALGVVLIIALLSV